MNRIHSHFDEIDLIGKLADLKEQHYRNTLALSAMIEILIDKGILTAQDIRKKAAELDAVPTPDPTYPIS